MTICSNHFKLLKTPEGVFMQQYITPLYVTDQTVFQKVLLGIFVTENTGNWPAWEFAADGSSIQMSLQTQIGRNHETEEFYTEIPVA